MEDVIELQNNCANCGANAFAEDNSGFYVCTACGAQSEDRFGMMTEGALHCNTKRKTEESYGQTHVTTLHGSHYTEGEMLGYNSEDDEIDSFHSKTMKSIRMAFWALVPNGNEEKFKEYLENAKICWEMVLPSHKKKKKKRTRRITEENIEKKKFKGNFREEIEKRNLNKANIKPIEDLKELSTSNKLSFFLEEYEEVRRSMKIRPNMMNAKVMASLIKLRTGREETGTFEELIHSYYKILLGNKPFKLPKVVKREKNELFTSDTLLSVVKSALELSNISVSLDRLSSLFRQRSFASLQESTFSLLKGLKPLNKATLAKNQKTSSLSLCLLSLGAMVDRLDLPSVFLKTSSKVLEKCLASGRLVSVLRENLCLGVILFNLKLIYGFNNNPYLFLLKLKDNLGKEYSDDILSAIDKLKQVTDASGLDTIISTFPCKEKLIEQIADKIEQENSSKLPWKAVEYKSLLSNTAFKELRKVYSGSSEKYSIETEIKLVSSLNKPKKKRKGTVKDRRQTKKQESYLNQYLEDEMQFINKVKPGKRVAVPLPCDEFVRFNRKAYKLADFKQPEEFLAIQLMLSEMFDLCPQQAGIAYRAVETAVLRHAD